MASTQSARRTLTVLLSFGAFGLTNSVWQSALPDLQNSLHLSSSKLGSVITIGYLVAIPLMSIGGRIVDKIGANAICGIALLFMAASLLGIVQIHTYPLLVGCSLFYSAAVGMLDIGINAAAIAREHEREAPLLPTAHGFYSLFAMVSAILYGGLLYFGGGFHTAYIAVSSVVAVFALVLLIGRPMPESRRSATQGAHHAVGLHLFLDLALLAVAGLVFLDLMGDATLGNWSAIYLRSISHGSAIASSLAVAVYHASMACGRFFVNHLLRTISRRQALLIAGLLISGGMVVGIAAHSLALIIGSIFVVGLAIAVVMPIGLSIGGDLKPGSPGDVSAVLIMAAYVSNLISPLLIGALADRYGIRGALGTVVIVGVLIAICGPRVAAMASRRLSVPAD
jgi:MFS family permease